MKKRILGLWIAAILCAGAQTDTSKAKPEAREEDDLRQSLGEAGSSPIEMIRALEKHLAKYPDSKRRSEIERAMVKAAVEARDNTRILKYGEKYLEQEPTDLVVLERVTRLLVVREDKASNQKGLKYAQMFLKGMGELEKEKPSGRMTAQLRDDLDRGLSRGYIFQAKAKGHLGEYGDAVDLAKQAYASYPSPEPAHEVAHWLLKMGKTAEAIPFFADAFALPDTRLTEEERQKIRQQMGEAYRKLHDSEAGLGDMVLAAYDRALVVQQQRNARLRSIDPNANLTDPMDYTLGGVNGEKLDLKSLRGKVVILDFWATWCGPCRVQYPMYEQVKQSFKGRGDVVFLGINTDQERELVKPFLQEQKWNKAVYFEDGLSPLLKVSSIPCTIILNRKGEMATRMNGFVPERFVDMLTERIREALAQE